MKKKHALTTWKKPFYICKIKQLKNLFIKKTVLRFCQLIIIVRVSKIKFAITYSDKTCSGKRERNLIYYNSCISKTTFGCLPVLSVRVPYTNEVSPAESRVALCPVYRRYISVDFADLCMRSQKQRKRRKMSKNNV